MVLCSPWREWLMLCNPSWCGRPDSRGVLLIQVQAWLMVLFATIVIWRQKIRELLSKNASVRSKECAGWE
eukprot:355947-Chlamydomonas_euryale.AAC.17